MGTNLIRVIAKIVLLLYIRLIFALDFYSYNTQREQGFQICATCSSALQDLTSGQLGKVALIRPHPVYVPISELQLKALFFYSTQITQISAKNISIKFRFPDSEVGMPAHL